MVVSYGFEQRGILLAQAEITERRHRQQLAIHKMYELEMEKQEGEMQQQIRQMERTLDVAVIEALQKVLIFFPPNPIARESDVLPDMPNDWVNRIMGLGL